MQTEQRLIYFSYNNHNMITIFEYFIIDCDQSLNITVDRNYSCVHNVEFTFTENIMMHFKWLIYQNGPFIWL